MSVTLQDSLQEIKRNISYIGGPQGQTVIIVPPKRESSEEEVNECMYGCCLALTLIVAFVCLLMGIIYGSIMISLYEPGKSWNNDFFWTMVDVAYWFLGIGGVFFVLSLCICKCQNSDKSERRRRYMHEDGSDRHQLVEDADDETFGMLAISQDRSPLSGRRAPHQQDYQWERQYLQPSSFQPSEYMGPRQPSPPAVHHPFPYGANNPHIPISGQRSPSGSQFQMPGRTYPGMSEEMANHFQFQPTTERSFSPDSDTTYLSYRS